MRINRNFFVIRISKELQQKKRKKMTISTTGYLGIKYSEEENTKGFIVADVQDDSPAQMAGFKKGDIITAIGNEKVDNYQKLIALVTQHPPGYTLDIFFINALEVDDTITKKKVTLAERPLVLDIPLESQDMRYNLQFGEVVMIGSVAAKVFPEVNIGDNLLVHHSVEYKERSEGDNMYNDWHLLQENDQYEWRVVHCAKEVLGVWKVKETDPAKSIIPYKDFIFCHYSFRKASFQMQNGIWLPDAWEKTVEDLTTQLDELRLQVESLNTSSILKAKTTDDNYKEKEQLIAAMNSLNKERADITRRMHQKHLVEAKVIFVNPLTNEENVEVLEPGDTILTDYFTLYPLDIFGTHYVLARPKTIEAFTKN